MSDLLLRGVDRAAGLRIAVAVTTDLVAEVVRRHEATGVGACALGRALTSGLLLATLTKSRERVTLQLDGDGPLGGVVVDAEAEAGSVAFARGYLKRPEAAREPLEGRGHLAAVLGKSGVVNVVRDLGLKERYQGQVALLTGEIDEDVEGYLRISEQVPSALGCDVVLGAPGTSEVIASAGVLVQALPGGDPLDVRPAQHALRTSGLYDQLRAGVVDPRALAHAVYGGAVEFLDQQPLEFRCRCSQARVENMLRILTTVDIDEIIAERGEAEVTCNFCGARFVVEKPALERIREEIAGMPRGNN